MNLTLSEEKRINTKGAAEILVKMRLGVLKNLVEELELSINIYLVLLGKNKADTLTRVKKTWIEMEKKHGDYVDIGVCSCFKLD